MKKWIITVILAIATALSSLAKEKAYFKEISTLPAVNYTYISPSMLSSMGIFYALYRLFSRNVPQRQRENERFLELLKQPGAARERRRKKAADRGALVRVECEECGQGLSVPKGKGTIRVVCPKCQHETITTT